VSDSELVARGFAIGFNAVIAAMLFRFSTSHAEDGDIKESLIALAFSIGNAGAAVANTLYVLSRLVTA
jgi:hypothetical protein